MSRPIRDSTLAQRATSEALRVSDRIHNVLDIVGRGDLVGLRRLERDGLVLKYTEPVTLYAVVSMLEMLTLSSSSAMLYANR
jgi:hypothetical protein